MIQVFLKTCQLTFKLDSGHTWCCSSHTLDDLERAIRETSDLDGDLSDFVGDTIPARMKQIEEERRSEAEKRKREAEDYQLRQPFFDNQFGT